MKAISAANRCLGVAGAALTILGGQGFAANSPAAAKKVPPAVKAAKAPFPGLQPTKYPNVWVRFAPQPQQRPAPVEASIYVLPGAKIPPEGIAPKAGQQAATIGTPTIHQGPNGSKYILLGPSQMEYVHARIDEKGRTVVTCGDSPKASPAGKEGAK
jgi:hypothetical protein